MTVQRASDNPFPSILFLEHVDPATPPSGHWRMFVDTDNTFKVMDDAGTVTALGGSGLSDPMTTRGDIIVRNASNVTARLAIGSTGKVLQSDGTDISWQTPAGGGPTTIRGRVAGNGTITSGTGFTITHNGTGDYTVNYTSSFTNAPVFVGSPGDTDMSSYTCILMMVAGQTDTTSATRVIMRDLASTTTRDLPWMFIAMEP